jgi:hypothetical protein
MGRRPDDSDAGRRRARSAFSSGTPSRVFRAESRLGALPGALEITTTVRVVRAPASRADVTRRNVSIFPSQDLDDHEREQPRFCDSAQREVLSA